MNEACATSGYASQEGRPALQYSCLCLDLRVTRPCLTSAHSLHIVTQPSRTPGTQKRHPPAAYSYCGE